nr:DUF922 domain-containing protein [Nocardia stercoris]
MRRILCRVLPLVILAVTITGLSGPAVAQLDCQPIAGRFRSSDLCTALKTPAEDGFGQWWSVSTKTKSLANCQAAASWIQVVGNAGITNWRWNRSYTFAPLTASSYRVAFTGTPLRTTTITLTTPTWPGETAVQQKSVAEYMRRVRAHEIGHVRVLAEVARVQTGSATFTGTATDARQWGEQWVAESDTLANGSEQNYDTVTRHGVTQHQLGGSDTVFGACRTR